MKPEITSRYLIKCLAYTGIFNTGIALFLTLMKYRDGLFLDNFIFSQSIGLSICSGVLMAHHWIKPGRPWAEFLTLMGGMTSGAVVGIFLGSLLSGKSPESPLKEYGFFLQILFLSLLFGAGITYFFVSREKLAAVETQVQEEKIRRLTSEKQVVEAHLLLLQAQIEPHFLFNTLSNIRSLLDRNLEEGKAMLEDFIRFLRMALSRSRERISTIDQEMEMNRSYLNLFKVRMGDRLFFRMDIPEKVKGLPLPPMLVQPLVENALRHGLEPKIEGGEIFIKADRVGDILRIEVADTGLGFQKKSPSGLGLSNLRERLQTLYGPEGRLVLKENHPTGLRAIIEVPCVSP